MTKFNLNTNIFLCDLAIKQSETNPFWEWNVCFLSCKIKLMICHSDCFDLLHSENCRYTTQSTSVAMSGLILWNTSDKRLIDHGQWALFFFLYLLLFISNNSKAALQQLLLESAVCWKTAVSLYCIWRKQIRCIASNLCRLGSGFYSAGSWRLVWNLCFFKGNVQSLRAKSLHFHRVLTDLKPD